jgi:PAS domain S-box-containing protein
MCGEPPPPHALIVEQVPACIAIFDADMRYLAASRGFLSMYSYVFSRRLPSPTEVVGRSHREIFPDMPSRWREVDARVLEGEELAEQEEFVPHKYGRTACVRWSMKPWRTASGQIGGALLFIELITEQVAAKRALAESEARSALRLSMPPSASHTLALTLDGSEPTQRYAVFSAGQWMNS